ncbi:MAG: hypothetical protein RL060_650 [Bacteroidota bacterium]
MNFPRMHVSLYVSNIAQSVNFYTSFFGLSAVKVKSNYAKYVLETPSLIISFVENKERVKADFGHLGFQVETAAQLQEALTNAKNKNLPVKEEMGTSCCYAVQDKFWVADPDGYQWEVYLFREDAEFNDPHYAQDETEVCCMPPAKTKETEVVSSPTCAPGSGCC